jgi:hypothetical protein
MTRLSVAPQVLMWNRESDRLRQSVEQEFEVLLNEAFLRESEEAGAANGSASVDGVALGAERDMPEEAIRHVVRSPRVVRYLLWPRTRDKARIRKLLSAALTAERALLGLETPTGFSGWTADYRAFIRASGHIEVQPTLAGCIPIDVRSPHARSIDLWGGSRIQHPPRKTPSPEAAERLVARAERAWQGINAADVAVANCVTAWTRVIVAQSEDSGKFWSGSNGQYVGRVVLANADAARSPVEELADAIVHEAIHGFLYMHEYVEPWVKGYSLYTDEGAIASPWSGSLLPVRPFMQACFVWYGLAMFWALHVGANTFDQQQTYYQLGRALVGFRSGALADLLLPWKTEVSPEMIELIDELQRIVRSMLV